MLAQHSWIKYFLIPWVNESTKLVSEIQNMSDGNTWISSQRKILTKEIIRRRNELDCIASLARKSIETTTRLYDWGCPVWGHQRGDWLSTGHQRGDWLSTDAMLTWNIYWRGSYLSLSVSQEIRQSGICNALLLRKRFRPLWNFG